MEDQDRDHISSRSHFSGRSDQELDEMLDELRAGKIGCSAIPACTPWIIPSTAMALLSAATAAMG